MRWADFRLACPELAALANDWIIERHVLLLGTVRADGSPRISVVECDEVDGDLRIGMIWRSTKALDLLRDPRLTAHSVPPGKDNPAGDLKLYGKGVTVSGADKRAYEDTLHARIAWRPSEPYHCFTLDIESAGLVRFEGNGRTVLQWRAGGTLRRTVHHDVS